MKLKLITVFAINSVCAHAQMPQTFTLVPAMKKYEARLKANDPYAMCEVLEEELLTKGCKATLEGIDFKEISKPLLEKEAQAGNPLAMAYLVKYGAFDYALLSKATLANEPLANIELGNAYVSRIMHLLPQLNGRSPDDIANENFIKAFQLYDQRAQAGDRVAMRRIIAVPTRRLDNTGTYAATKMRWVNKAAELGEIWALTFLASKDLANDNNSADALGRLENLANSGDWVAMQELARSHPTQRAIWAQKASEAWGGCAECSNWGEALGLDCDEGNESLRWNSTPAAPKSTSSKSLTPPTKRPKKKVGTIKS